MCGIAGIVLERPGVFPASLLSGLERSLHHRGPDDKGWLVLDRGQVRRGQDLSQDLEGEILLFSARLAILDLTDAARQPMSTDDDRHHIVFNGEIYNYLELRDELEALGETFSSRGDTEVLLSALARWGTEALPRLVGMFAFAVLDVRERTLRLGRDPFGIKPLYYARWRGGFAFASEPGTLIELPWIGRAVNPERLYRYLRFGVTDYGGGTFFEEVKQLACGHRLELDLDRPGFPVTRPYATLDASSPLDISLDEAASRLRALFEQNVKLHLRSDVPVGVAFSGGIDSSANVMTMRRVAGDALDLNTFSYVPAERELSEEHWIDLVGQVARARMHKTCPTAVELARDLDALVDAQGEPFGGTSIYAQYRVFQLARMSNTKVMLDGQGGDELFAGYRGYLPTRIASLLRSGKLLDASRLLRALAELPGFSTRWCLAATGARLLPPAVTRRVRPALGARSEPPWLDGSWFSERGIPSSPPWQEWPTDLNEQQRVTLFETSLPMLLRFEDRSSMAFSIESRVPFLTLELAGFALSLPEEYIIGPRGTTKRVFREAMRGIVPDDVLNRSDKIAFTTPEASWLRSLSGWIDGVLASETARSIPAFRDDLPRSSGEAGIRSGALEPGIWRYLNTIKWAERFEVSFT